MTAALQNPKDLPVYTLAVAQSYLELFHAADVSAQKRYEIRKTKMGNVCGAPVLLVSRAKDVPANACSTIVIFHTQFIGDSWESLRPQLMERVADATKLKGFGWSAAQMINAIDSYVGVGGDTAAALW